MLTREELPYPKKGLIENWELAKGVPGFSRDEKNCLTQDPITKRLRGAQRSGLSKLIAGSTGSGKVQDLAVVTRPAKPIDYGVPENGSNQLFNTSEFRIDTGALAAVYDLDTDYQNNVYVLNGSRGWAKYSAEGKEILAVQVPMLGAQSVLRSIYVDPYGGVYVSVGEGGEQDDAAIWKWTPYIDDNGDLQYGHLWTIKAGGFIGDITTFNNLLYAVCNDDRRYVSKALVYSGIDSASPVLEQAFEIPYPCYNFAVKRTGDLVTSHPPFASRGLSPITTSSTARVSGSTPNDFEDNGDINIWARYRAVDIEASDLGGLESDPRVYRLRDTSRYGQPRHFYTNTAQGTAPHYHEQGPLHGLPAVFFDGEENMLQTLGNPSVLKENADMQLSALPQYEDAAFCIIAVVTPVAEASMGSFLGFSLENTLSKTEGTAYEWGITFNADEADTPTVSSGLVSVRDEGSATDGWNGTGVNPYSQDFTTYTGSGAPSPATIAPQAGILTLYCDGRLNHAGSTKSILRWNGVPIDIGNGRPIEGSGPTYLGYHVGATARGFFHGWVHDILVLDRYDRSTASSGCFSDHAGGTEAYAYPDIAHNGSSDTIMEQLEAYMAREHGLGHLLDPGDNSYELGDGVTDSDYEHPYGDGSTALNQGETAWIGTSQANANEFQTANAIVTKWDGPTGRQVWIAADIGGAGYGLALIKLRRPLTTEEPDEERIVTTGPEQASPADTDQINVIVDQGDNYAVGAGMNLGSTNDFDDPFVRIAVDDYPGVFGSPGVRPNLYLPVHLDGTGSPAATMYVISLRVAVGSPEINVIYQTDSTAAGSQFAHAVALPKRKIDYHGDLPLVQTSFNDWRAESVFLGCPTTDASGAAANGGGFVKVDLVTVSHNTDAPRTYEVIAVNDGDIKKKVGAAWSTITGGSGALASGSRLVNSTTLFGKTYFVDGGAGYKVYDPTRGTSGEVIDWEATDGEIPPYCRFIQNYRGRIVLWGDPNDGWNWHMAAKDRPTDFNFAPPGRSPDQAISGNTPDLTGRIPGIINLFAPLSDDTAIIGTQEQILVLRGDPMRDGQIDQVSKKYGTAIGNAWTQDPEGMLYVFLNYGGVMMVDPYRRSTRRLSVDRIEKRLQDIDFSTHYVEMDWNWYDEALHVLVMPFAQSGSAIPEHYVWERKVDAWHPVEYGLQGLQPTAVMVLDGDADDDRLLAYGCEDGYVRFVDPTALDDDGTAIDSWFVVGPIVPENPKSDFQYRFQSWEITLANDQQGARLGLFAANEPEELGPFTEYALMPGLNPRLMEKIRGIYAYARIGNSQANERWAYETGAYQWARAGRKRRRSLV